MGTNLEQLANYNVEAVAVEPRLKTKHRIRGNTELMNKLLLNNAEGTELSSSFGSGKKTVRLYKRQASQLFKFGIRKIEQYDTSILNEIVEFSQSYNPIYFPHLSKKELRSSDLLRIIIAIRTINTQLKLLKTKPGLKIDLGCEQLDFSSIINHLVAFLNVEKSVRNNVGEIDETVRCIASREFINFYIDSINTLNVAYNTRAEKSVNRRHLYSIRAIVIAIFNRQTTAFKNGDPQIKLIDVHDSQCIDRVVSTIISLVE